MSSQPPGPSLLVIGIGNSERGDDGIGHAAVAALEARGLPGAQFVTCQGDGLQLLEVWQRADLCLLIDAATSGAPHGTIYRFEAHEQALPADLRLSSTHTFGVLEAIELARVLDQLPARLVVYAIEGKNFAPGAGLSQEVERAVLDVVERAANEIRSHLDECNRDDFVRESPANVISL
jgi:hydrogenase maturation protease